MRMIIGAAALLCTASLMPQSAMAWSDDGHKIVALIADHYLLPAARDKVKAMLSADMDTLTAHDIASEATWADKYLESDRTTTHERYDRTHNWHFADIQAGRPNIPAACYGQPRLAPGTLASQGPATACVIDKIDQFADELANSKVSPGERLLALKFLLNLVADVHQPLRVADESNGFGAGIRVTATFMTPGDLFTVWDNVLISRLAHGANPDDIARVLISRISQADQNQWASRATHLWALEAHQLGVDQGYGTMLTVFDDQGRFALQDPEVDKAVQTVALQLSRAGVRLAYVLNEALAPASQPAATQKNIAAIGDRAAGRQFILTACSNCHVVRPNQELSTTAPDFQAIAKTRGISEVALREFLFGAHPTMPTLHLSQKQANDVIAHILSLQDSP